jgi:hypothetical protein
MYLSEAKELMGLLATSGSGFSLVGPDGFEDMLAEKPETEFSYFKRVQMTTHNDSDFGLLIYVYSQILPEAVGKSSRIKRLFSKTISQYERQNLKLAMEGDRFFLAMAMLEVGSGLLKLLNSMSQLSLGVELMEKEIGRKLKISLNPKS